MKITNLGAGAAVEAAGTPGTSEVGAGTPGTAGALLVGTETPGVPGTTGVDAAGVATGAVVSGVGVAAGGGPALHGAVTVTEFGSAHNAQRILEILNTHRSRPRHPEPSAAS